MQNCITLSLRNSGYRLPDSGLAFNDEQLLHWNVLQHLFDTTGPADMEMITPGGVAEAEAHR